jgi:hypothetical protein
VNVATTTPRNHVTKRQRLRQFLLREIEILKESEDDPDVELLTALHAAVEGLENLEFGQIDEIFAPGKKRLWGSQPATVKRYQAHAVGSVLALKKRGYKVADAEKVVASAYGIEPDALHKWRNTVPKTKDDGILEIIYLYKSAVKFPNEPPIDRILADVKKKGEIYREAIASKEGNKPD